MRPVLFGILGVVFAAVASLLLVDRQIPWQTKVVSIVARGLTYSIGSRYGLTFSRSMCDRLIDGDSVPVSEVLPNVFQVEYHVDVEQPTGAVVSIPLRIFTPRQLAGKVPLMLYIHGGGYVHGRHNGSATVKLARKLADENKFIVVTVGYRHAPEHPFPAAPDDVFSVLRWISEANVPQLKYADKKRVLVAGSSAGGNLAAVAVGDWLLLGPTNIKIIHLTLVYPAMNHISPTTFIDNGGKIVDHDDAYVLPLENRRFFYSSYIGTGPIRDQVREEIVRNRRFCPRFGSFSGFPPTHIICGTADPLLPDSRDYAYLMRKAHVAVTESDYVDAAHAFMSVDMLPEHERALQEVVDVTREAVRPLGDDG